MKTFLWRYVIWPPAFAFTWLMLAPFLFLGWLTQPNRASIAALD